MSLTNYGEIEILKWFFTTLSASRPTSWYVALHLSDPGEAGTAGEATTTEDADYVRKSITFDTPASGQAGSAAAVSWTVSSASAGYTVTHISICDAATGGNVLATGALLASRALVANDVLTFNAGDIIAALD